MVDVTVRYDSKPSSHVHAVAENVRKYQHLKHQVQQMTSASNIKFTGFP